MSTFDVRFDTDEQDTWTLLAPYERQTAIGPITVPAGFKTDLASTPRTVWLRYPRWGRWSGAAVVHDFLYRTRPHGINRRQADDIFHDLMREDGVRHGDARIIYVSVREYGDRAWRKWRRDE